MIDTGMNTEFKGYINRKCPVCGAEPKHRVICHKHKASICMDHCYEGDPL